MAMVAVPNSWADAAAAQQDVEAPRIWFPKESQPQHRAGPTNLSLPDTSQSIQMPDLSAALMLDTPLGSRQNLGPLPSEPITVAPGPDPLQQLQQQARQEQQQLQQQLQQLGQLHPQQPPQEPQMTQPPFHPQQTQQFFHPMPGSQFFAQKPEQQMFPQMHEQQMFQQMPEPQMFPPQLPEQSIFQHIPEQSFLQSQPWQLPPQLHDPVKGLSPPVGIAAATLPALPMAWDAVPIASPQKVTSWGSPMKLGLGSQAGPLWGDLDLTKPLPSHCGLSPLQPSAWTRPEADALGSGSSAGQISGPAELSTHFPSLAGRGAQQDRDILETLQSSGLALNLSSLNLDSTKHQASDWSRILNASDGAASGLLEARRSSSNMSAPRPPVRSDSRPPSPKPPLASESVKPQTSAVELRSGPMLEAEEYVSGYTPHLHMQRFSYPGGATVDFLELAPVLRPVAIANASQARQAVQALEKGEHVRAALKIYRECDKEGCGFLTWSNGGIRDFVIATFQDLGLVPPAETQTYAAHTLFDSKRKMCLSARQSLCLIDALFRAVFLFGGDGSQEQRVRPTSAPRTSVRKEEPSPVKEELAEAQAETERLRRELEELRAAEAEAEAVEAAAADQVYGGAAFSGTAGMDAAGFPSSPSRETAALVWTARAHAENRRLERELKSLRSVARRQRGEVQWLHNVKVELGNASRDKELEREQLQLLELRKEEEARKQHEARKQAMEAEADLERQRQIEQRREQELERLLRDREDRRRRIQTRERELQEQEIAWHRDQEHLRRKEEQLKQREEQLLAEREQRLSQGENLRQRELQLSSEMGQLKAGSFVPGEPEEEADADSSGEAAAQAAAQSLENRKLRRELESLRALAQWQQGEVGAAIACSASRSSAPRMEASPPEEHRSKGSLVMASMAAQTLAEGQARQAEPVTSPPSAPPTQHRRDQAVKAGIDEYDRTVRALMSRVLGRDDVSTPGMSEAADRSVTDGHRSFVVH